MKNPLVKLVPAPIKKELERKIKGQVSEVTPPPLSANSILGTLYTQPPYNTSENGKLTWSRQKTSRRSADDPLPFPPNELRMAHPPSDQGFLATGEYSARWIRRIMEREGVDLTRGASVLDWGCAAGRVLRHFVEEAKTGEFWGVDEYSPCIIWGKENLSPPFKFLTSTAYPHLPFEDGKFTLIYALSVFTHVLDLVDMWLMELRRILAPGGYALFTIHDEHTWQYLSEDEGLRRSWMDRGYWVNEGFSKGLEHDVEIAGALNNWSTVTTFFKTDYIAREWGQYLDVVSFEPRCEGYQTAVVLRKPAAGDTSGNAYATGATDITNFSPINPLFVAKISDPPQEPIRVVLSRDEGGQLRVTITITNPLVEPVPSVTVTLVRASTLDGTQFVDGAPAPQSLGTVNPGQSVVAVATFPGTKGVPAGFARLVRVDLSYTGGTYTDTKQVVTP